MEREEVIGGGNTEVFQENELTFGGGDAKNDFWGILFLKCRFSNEGMKV